MLRPPEVEPLGRDVLEAKSVMKRATLEPVRGGAVIFEADPSEASAKR